MLQGLRQIGEDPIIYNMLFVIVCEVIFVKEVLQKINKWGCEL